MLQLWTSPFNQACSCGLHLLLIHDELYHLFRHAITGCIFSSSMQREVMDCMRYVLHVCLRLQICTFRSALLSKFIFIDCTFAQTTNIFGQIKLKLHAIEYSRFNVMYQSALAFSYCSILIWMLCTCSLVNWTTFSSIH